jgi:hypothetical protein
MTSDDVRKELKAMCAGNQAYWARNHGISPQHVSDVLAGRREPGKKLASAMGLRRVVSYVRVKV